MPWSTIASNQTVSRSNLQNAVNTSVFILKNAITGTSSKQVTKAEAESYVYLNTSTAAWTALTSNQLPVKSDFTAATTYAVDILAAWGTATSNYNYDIYAYYDSTAAQYMGQVASNFCVALNTIIVPSGSTLYIYALRAAAPNDRVYVRGGNTCPANLAVTCTFNAGTITANAAKAVTVYIDGSGNPQTCT